MLCNIYKLSFSQLVIRLVKKPVLSVQRQHQSHAVPASWKCKLLQSVCNLYTHIKLNINTTISPWKSRSFSSRLWFLHIFMSKKRSELSCLSGFINFPDRLSIVNQCAMPGKLAKVSNGVPPKTIVNVSAKDSYLSSSLWAQQSELLSLHRDFSPHSVIFTHSQQFFRTLPRTH